MYPYFLRHHFVSQAEDKAARILVITVPMMARLGSYLSSALPNIVGPAQTMQVCVVWALCMYTFLLQHSIYRLTKIIFSSVTMTAAMNDNNDKRQVVMT